MKYFLKMKNWRRLSKSNHVRNCLVNWARDINGSTFRLRTGVYPLFLAITLLSFSSMTIALNSPVDATTIEANPVTKHSEKTDTWSFLHNYKAKYSVLYDGNKVGHATRELSKKDNQWVLTTQAKLSKLFFKIKSKEFAEFQINEGALLTDRFFSQTKRTFKKERKMEQVFDWKTKTENGYNGKKQWQLELNTPIFDRVSHVIQLRSDLLSDKKSFVYGISYKGKREIYTYTLEEKEVIKTKMGELSALKLVRKKPNGDVFVFWLSPDLNYFPIKMAQFEKDKADVIMLLDSIDYVPTQLDIAH